MKYINRRSVLGFSIAAPFVSAGFAEQVSKATSANIGQLILTGFRGVRLSDPEVETLRRYIERGLVAGVMLLKRNIQNPQQVAELVKGLQLASPSGPLIIAIDQEGGAVSRLGSSSGFLDWRSAAWISRNGGDEGEVYSYYYDRVIELRSVGINLNLAPVVDLNVNPQNPIIGGIGRSFGSDEIDVIRFASIFIKAHRDLGVKTCLKHFPGHGSSVADSHLGSVDVSNTWHSSEIVPFERLVRAGLADTIMNAHVLHEDLSDEPWVPTSLSTNCVREIREGLSFLGPIITDDMQMKAVTDLLTPFTASIEAIKAGNSLLIYSNYERKYRVEGIEELHSVINSALSENFLQFSSIEAAAETVSSFRSSLLNPY